MEECGRTVLVTEKRTDSRGCRSGLVVIRVSTKVVKYDMSWSKRTCFDLET